MPTVKIALEVDADVFYRAVERVRISHRPGIAHGQAGKLTPEEWVCVMLDVLAGNRPYSTRPAAGSERIDAGFHEAMRRANRFGPGDGSGTGLGG